MKNKYKLFKELALKRQDEVKSKKKQPRKSQNTKRKTIKAFFTAILRFFCAPRYKSYERPTITPTDCAFILINTHLNFRAFCRFADHAIEQGPLIVTLIYTASHLFLCPAVCYLYGFLGRYGERGFINIWDMVPLFQGISGSVCLYESLKMIETSLLLSTAIMMLINGYYTDHYMFQSQNVTLCNNGSMPLGYAMNYGISSIFKHIGLEKESHHLDLLLDRVYVVIGIWVAVMLLHFLKTRKVQLFFQRGMPIMIMLWIAVLVMSAVINNSDYNLSYGFRTRTSLTYIYDYMHIIAFSITDYLPSHWITIGYLSDRDLTKTQVMSTSMVSMIAGCGISYATIFFFAEYAKAINADLECIKSFGVHFFLVAIPYSIRYRSQRASVVLIPVYTLVIILKALSYIAASHQLFMWAVVNWKQYLFRYKNTVSIFILILLGTCSTFLCIPSIHLVLLDIHYVAFYHATMILFLLTIIGIEIYGLQKINGDHQFLTGSEYPHILWMKFVFIFALYLKLLYFLCVINEIHIVIQKDIRALIILLILLSPLILGIFKTIVLQKKYHYTRIYPLSTWGKADKESRDDRRQRNLRQMFIARTSRECMHNCLLQNKNLEQEIYEELNLRNSLLDKIECEDNEDNWSSASTSSNIQLSTKDETHTKFDTFKLYKDA